MQVADITCGVDGNLATDLQDWEGEFFPNISYIKYEVRDFLCQVEFPIIFLHVIEFASYHRLVKCRLKGIRDLIVLLSVYRDLQATTLLLTNITMLRS